MEILVPIIIVIIIGIQVFFFTKNLNRMKEFGRIFESNNISLELIRNEETGLVEGIDGYGNSIFNSIVNSINKYLGNNSGSVIDFGLLKDAVDRHCDSAEDDIAAQTPIPLYWGLAGTMAGVILGLWDLLASGAILAMLGGSDSVSADEIAEGVNSLLSGVAWAMVASICGILLTTFNSILFKRCKLKEEKGKNSFLAWMQSVLLPELPSDTSDTINKLVRNLNRFNNTFANNTAELGDVLKKVNESYSIQADIIKAVHDMDVMKMAEANVRVMKELEECTDKLEDFNNYLLDIKGYTDAIHRFETQFTEQAERLHVLEEIRDFFGRHKQEISRTVADADSTLQDSLGMIKESATEGVREIHNLFVSQSEQFKEILTREKEDFEQVNKEMKAKFSSQLEEMPRLAKQLEEISAIPARLDRLIEKVEKSNAELYRGILTSMTSRNANPKNEIMGIGEKPGNMEEKGFFNAGWMKWSVWGAVIVIAVTCIFNVVAYFVPKSDPVAEALNEMQMRIEEISETQQTVPETQQINTVATGAAMPAENIKQPEANNVSGEAGTAAGSGNVQR